MISNLGGADIYRPVGVKSEGIPKAKKLFFETAAHKHSLDVDRPENQFCGFAFICVSVV